MMVWWGVCLVAFATFWVGWATGSIMVLHSALKGQWASGEKSTRLYNHEQLVRVAKKAIEDAEVGPLTLDEIRERAIMDLEPRERVSLMLELCSKLSDEDMDYLQNLGRSGNPEQEQKVQAVQRVAGVSHGERYIDLG